MNVATDDIDAVMRARILVVQEETLVAADLERGLRAFGYVPCATAASGEEAVELALASHPDLILMDVRLGGELDGIEAARRIRQDLDVPVVFLSAECDAETLRRAASVGPYGYLLKPYDDRELQSALLMALCKHRAFAELDRRVQQRTAALVRSEVRYRLVGAVADFGVFALGSPDLAGVLQRSVDLVAESLGTDLANVLELQADGTNLRLVAGAGWPATIVGHAEVAAEPGCWSARALQADEPVVIQDADGQPAFSLADFKREAGVVSGISVVIHAPGHRGRPFGLLETHSRTRRLFSPEELSFLQAMANVIAAALLRSSADRQIRDAERAAHEERDRARAAEEALRARDQFLSVASHELRTPVAALQLQLEALRQLVSLTPVRLDPRISEKAERAMSSVGRLAQLVDAVLDVSRIALGHLRLEREPLDLAEVARTVLQRYEGAARRVGCAISFESAAPVPGLWDRARLEQVVTQLLSNAIKFGAGKPIDVRLAPRDGGGRLSVTDRGPGIAPDDASRILGRFERAVSHRNYGGLGLGLYLAGQIVRAHGGNLEVVSRLGEGATFIVDL